MHLTRTIRTRKTRTKKSEKNLEPGLKSDNLTATPNHGATNNQPTNHQMIKITNQNDVSAAFAKFQPAPDGASPTCRVFAGQWESANLQEWAERGTIDGVPARVFYAFENSECESEDASDYPWDAEHISEIQIAEKYDGEFEVL